MGLGDQLIGSGLARGFAARGKRAAFGDGQKIIWDHNSEPIFRYNPNIAAPGSEGAPDLEWIAHHRGNRIYNRHVGDKWVWNYDFKPVPGELFFDDIERRFADTFGRGDFVVIEPNLPEFKTVAVNKRWRFENYWKLARSLMKRGIEVRQFYYPSAQQLPGATLIKSPKFRHAVAVLAKAKLYIGPEGGLHHGAAAVGTKAVVLFGGFIPPQVTGYDFHINLTGGAAACGSINRCQHCIDAMERISVAEVEAAALSQLEAKAA